MTKKGSGELSEKSSAGGTDLKLRWQPTEHLGEKSPLKVTVQRPKGRNVMGWFRGQCSWNRTGEREGNRSQHQNESGGIY